jgi:hypothetical protein
MEPADTPDLETRLLADETGAARADLLKRLGALREECVSAKRQLSDREVFRRLQAANVAVNAAIRIVETLPAQRA